MELGPETHRSIDLHQIGEHRWKATNARGGGVSIGPGEDPDFTPVELLLAALVGCGAADLDYIAGKRAPFETFAARAEGHKVRDEDGSHLVQLKVTFDVTFPAGEGGDAAREILPAHPPADPGPALHGRAGPSPSGSRSRTSRGR